MSTLRVLSIDPGKSNTWYTCWEGRKLVHSGRFETPSTLREISSLCFHQEVKVLFSRMKMQSEDHLVLERYMHRAGSGGNVSEIMGAIIWTLATLAISAGIAVYMYTASAHKNSYRRFHTALYPPGILKRIGQIHGTFHPRLGRTDPCEHVIDAGTLGVYHILKHSEKI